MNGLSQRPAEKFLVSRHLSWALGAALTFSFCLASYCPSPAGAQNADLTGIQLATLQKSKPLVARTGAWQTYGDRLEIKTGQEKRPLFLTFTNGADGREKLTDLQVELGGKPFLTIKDFDASGIVNRRITGTVGVGNVPITVKVFGRSGARLTWTLSTEAVQVTEVKPSPFGLLDKVTVTGRNFSSTAAQNKVLIAGKPATVLSATETELQVKPPAHLTGGAQNLEVTSDSVKSNPFSVSVWGVPHVTRIDFLAAPPTSPLGISGSGFSPVASENVVKFGNVTAKIVSASENHIQCIVPDMHFPNWYVPITVTTRGLKSKERVIFHVNVLVVPNEGVPMH